MGLLSSAHNFLDIAASASFVRPIAEKRYWNKFTRNKNENLFWGVFENFPAAAKHAPKSSKIGYDNEESANILYTSAVAHWDFPMMFWLSRSFEQGMSSVFDLGGHIGIKYYAFRRPLSYPENLRWTVCDVPAVVHRGRELALTRATEGRLHFSEKMEDIKNHEILFASGSLQYLPETIDQILRKNDARPKRILINITPLHPSISYITLNSIGTSFCPYRVQSRTDFVESIQSLGYERRSEWENPGKSLSIPFRRELDVDSYSGFCFDAK